MFEQLFGSGKGSSLVEAAFEDVSTMLRQSAKMLDLSLRLFWTTRKLQVDLEDMDDVVDDGERMVRRTILQHLTVNPQARSGGQPDPGEHGPGCRAHR